MLVGCGATEYVINDKSKFINFEPDNHFLKLANKSQVNNIVLKIGNTCIYSRNSKGRICRWISKNALYIPTFKQNIFSVQAKPKKRAHISSEHENSQLIYPNAAVFNITYREHLHYLKNIFSAKNATHNLHTWHKISGHCNEPDIKKLPN